MNRKLSREVAYRVIYSHGFSNEGQSKNLSEAIETAKEGIKEQLDLKYIKILIDATTANLEQIDTLIAGSLRGFSFERLFPTDLSALRLGLAEMRFIQPNGPDQDPVPAEVIIDAVVTLAKKYGTEKSAGFVNGVLASVR